MIKHIILLLLFMPLAFAIDGGVVNQNTTVWCSITDAGIPTSVSYANITVYDPLNDIIINNKSMSYIQTGIYNYNFIPNITGNHLVVCNFYNTSFVAQATETLTVKEQLGLMEIAIILGLVALGVFLLYLSKDILKKPQGDVTNSVFKLFNTKNIAVFLHLAASWVIVAIVGFLSIASQGYNYHGLINSIFIVIAFGIFAFNILYLAIYVIYLVKIKMQGIMK